MKNFSIITALMVAGLCGCMSQPGARINPSDGWNPPAAASASECGASGNGCSETIAVATSIGIDYQQLVTACLARSDDGMHQFFWMSANAGFDAASSQGHAEVTALLLRQLGDQYFGGTLSREAANVREAVRDDLAYALGYYEGEAEDVSGLRRDYPETFPAGWQRKDVRAAVVPGN